MGENEYGTPIGIFVCEFCGVEFTVCPVPSTPENFKGCLHPDCPSYDPHLDLEVVFMTDAEIAKLPVVSMDMLRLRKTGILVKDPPEDT